MAFKYLMCRKGCGLGNKTLVMFVKELSPERIPPCPMPLFRHITDEGFDLECSGRCRARVHFRLRSLRRNTLLA